jgi:hypothetical protein
MNDQLQLMWHHGVCDAWGCCKSQPAIEHSKDGTQHDHTRLTIQKKATEMKCL